MKLVVFSGLLALAVAAPFPQSIEQIQHDLSQPLVPNVPGIAEHQAQVDALLALQGRLPGSNLHSAAEARHAQAEAALLALQQQQAAAAPAAPVVSNVGVIGASGIVGASGNIGPSGLCGPSGCVAF